MQYLLTEEEHSSLKAKAALSEEKTVALGLVKQKLDKAKAIIMADRPCIHDDQPDFRKRVHYCDDCPLGSSNQGPILCDKSRNYSK